MMKMERIDVRIIGPRSIFENRSETNTAKAKETITMSG